MSRKDSQENDVEVDATTHADEEALDRAVATGLTDAPGTRHEPSVSESRPGRGPAGPSQLGNDRSVARRQPIPE